MMPFAFVDIGERKTWTLPAQNISGYEVSSNMVLATTYF